MNTFIQWKGTDVCMDITCDCGYHSHIDGYFFNFFKCEGCGKMFKVGTSVEMKETAQVPHSYLSDSSDKDEENEFIDEQ